MLKSLWRVTAESWTRIESRGRRTLYIYTISMIVISGLDGFGLVLLNQLTNVNNGENSMLADNAGLGLTVIGMFVLRSTLAAGFTWMGYAAFAREEVRVGNENFSAYMKMDWGHRSREQVSDIYSFVDRGPFAMVQQLLLPIGTTIAEIVNAIVLFVVLMIMDPITAGTTVVFFFFVALVQHRVLSISMSRAGQAVADELNETYNILSDAFELGKVVSVMPSETLGPVLASSRQELAHARAKSIFLESLPRYLMESMLAVGVVVVGTVTVVTRGSEALLPSLSVFGVAGFRLLPIVNRIQGLILSFLGREPLARLALRELPAGVQINKAPADFKQEPPNILVSLQNVRYRYPGAVTDTLSGISIDFERGKQYALVGPSGSGKSTIVDMCLGLIAPDSGSVQWFQRDDDRVGYVPQDSPLAGTSLQGNVALEWNLSEVDGNTVERALRDVSLSEFVHTKTDARLVGLSGGQRQRLGLARALYRRSNVLFLDEPTSALDAETEHEVMSVVRSLHGTATVVIVAHRISTIQEADQVIYVENGRILGLGGFDEIRESIPQFARQIKLGTIVTDQ
jgi:ABC-type multidrug transport system fused ATPase/permease subunit